MDYEIDKYGSREAGGKDGVKKGKEGTKKQVEDTGKATQSKEVAAQESGSKNQDKDMKWERVMGAKKRKRISPGKSFTPTGEDAAVSKAVDIVNRLEELRRKSKNLSGKTSGEMKTLCLELKEVVSDMAYRANKVDDLTRQMDHMRSEMQRMESEIVSLRRKLQEGDSAISQGAPQESQESQAEPATTEPATTEGAYTTYAETTDEEEREIAREILELERLSRAHKDLAKKTPSPVFKSMAKQVDQEVRRLRKILQTEQASAVSSLEEFTIGRPDSYSAATARRKPNKRSARDGSGAQPTPGRRKVNAATEEPQRPPPAPKKQHQRRFNTEAVVVRATGDKSYADILAKARASVSLAELNITAPRIRQGAGGNLVIQIAGQGKYEKADTLAKKLSEALKDAATVHRPIQRAEAILVGVDPSASMEEVRQAISLAIEGDCQSFRFGEMRQQRSGNSSVWCQGPDEAIKKLTQVKMTIGWSRVTAKLLEPRPARCFRCMQPGHVKADCKSEVDYSAACFNCGQEGHKAGECRNPPNCLICKASHRAGRACSTMVNGGHPSNTVKNG